MSLDALSNSLLEARDRRQALLDALFRAPFSTVLMFGLNLPGEEKEGNRAERLFAWGERALAAAFPAQPVLRRSDRLGHFALYRSPLAPVEAKRLAVALEDAHPAGRLLDLDVFSAAGRPVDRASLGLPPRPCLLCPEPALACIRSQRHTSQALKAKAHMVIDAI